MPTLLDNLVINRVDLVDEGANSEAYIELYKRKETKMDLKEFLESLESSQAALVNKAIEDAKNASAAELAKSKEELESATAKLASVTEELNKAKKPDEEHEDVLKAMPEEVRKKFESLEARTQAAEAELRKAREKQQHDAAVLKAKELKALPVEESVLVETVKSADEKTIALLHSLAKSFGDTVLREVGKTAGQARHSTNSWNEIENIAKSIAKEEGISKQAAIAKAIEKNPTLYDAYIGEGTK